MAMIYVLKGRKMQKTLHIEAKDPLAFTFTEVYTNRRAADKALREHVAEELPELTEIVPDATVETFLKDGSAGHFSWQYGEYDVADNDPTATEWILSLDDPTASAEPILPYFIVERFEVRFRKRRKNHL